MGRAMHDPYLPKLRKAEKAQKAQKILIAVCALVGASVILDGGSGAPGSVLHKLRILCEDVVYYKHGDTPYGVWQELFPKTIDYYSLDRPAELSDRENDIAFVVTLMDCPERPHYELPGVPEGAPDNDIFYDHMTMLKWQICEDFCEIGGSSYNATPYALMSGDGIECMGSDGVLYDRVKVLEELGFYVKIIGSPVGEGEIVDNYLRNNIETDVGVKDLIRLHAYNMTDHPLVVLVDYDTMVMQPLESIFQELINSDAPASLTIDHAPEGPLNQGISKSFMVIKPSSTELDNILNTFKNTPYDPSLGWNSGGIGGFPGAMGTKGLLHYYYTNVNPTALVLNDCLSPIDNEYILTGFSVCRDATGSCSHCTNFNDVYVARVNEACGKPYDCPDVTWLPTICENILGAWFTKRLDYMNNHLIDGPIAQLAGDFMPSAYQGFCSEAGRNGYEKIIIDSPSGATPEMVARTPDIPKPDVAGTGSCPNTCSIGQYLTEDCACTSDECQACPHETRCQKKNGANPPMCIDCECGFCDYDGGSCCDFNSVDSCKAATNRKECAMQNAYFPGWPGEGDACSGVEVGAPAVPNGCGCQPNELTPCTYVPSVASSDDKCFIVRAHELLGLAVSPVSSNQPATGPCTTFGPMGGSGAAGTGPTIDLGPLTNFLFFFDVASSDANWQGATKGFYGDVAVDGMTAKERTSGSVPYEGTIYSNDATLGAWQDIVDGSPNAHGATGETGLINDLTSYFNNAFDYMDGLPADLSIDSSDLNGLNYQNGVSETIVIDIVSGFGPKEHIPIYGDAGDIFVMRWGKASGYGEQVKFASGGAIVPSGDLTAGNFVHLAGDLNSSGGGSNPPAPFPQGPRSTDGQGPLVSGGDDFSGGGFFVGYWLTIGNPNKNYESSSLSNGIFVGGWYSNATKWSMTSGTSGVHVCPNPDAIQSAPALPEPTPSLSTAEECAQCVAACEGGACVHAEGQTDVHAMQECLGTTIGKERNACRSNCAHLCMKIESPTQIG